MSELMEFRPTKVNQAISKTADNETVTASSPVAPKSRKRLSASARKAKLEAVKKDYLDGHPKDAIMLRNDLSKTQVSEMLTTLLLDGTVAVRPSDYQILSMSTEIKKIPGLNVPENGYVRIETTDNGVLLTPYPLKKK